MRWFVHGESFPEPVALIDWTAAGDVASPTTAEVLHYIHDALGSVVGLTNAAGALVERYTYDPYGQTYIEDPATQTFRGWLRFGNPWSWTGQRYDATTGLYHFLFRSYSPRLGRWLQRDPIGYADGPNLMEYVGSSPVGWLDPLGLTRLGEERGGEAWGSRVKHEMTGGSPRGDAENCYDEAIDDYGTMDGRRKTSEEYGNDFLTDEEKKAGRQFNAEMEQWLVDGGKETIMVLATIAWEGYEFLSNVNLAAALARAIASAGIKVVIVKGVRKFFTEAGEELTEKEAQKRIGTKLGEVLRRAAGKLTKSQQKEIKSLWKRIEEHKEKLAKYIRDPDAYDNLGFLKGATPEQRASIIEGRIRHLQSEISNWERRIDAILESANQL